MEAGTSYHLKAGFFDKNNAGSEIVANADLLMKQNKTGIQYQYYNTPVRQENVLKARVTLNHL